MIIDARLLPDDEQIETDVCVIGAGPAGLALAHECIGTGLDVVLLEGGGLEGDEALRSLVQGESVGFPYDRLDDARLRAFGGLAHTWTIDLAGDGKPDGARLHTLDPIDFEARSWVPHSGWPFGRELLEPYYDRAFAFFQVGPNREDEAYWFPPSTASDSSLESDRVDSTVFQFTRTGPFIDRYRDDVHRAPNVRCLLFANVTGLRTNDAGTRVDEVTVACAPGVDHVLMPAGRWFSRVSVTDIPQRSFTVRAKVFVLAAGATENARLLLASNERQPRGLGNQHDLVGRYFMEHPHIWSGFFVAADASFAAPSSRYRIQRVRDVPVMVKWTTSESTRRREGLLGYCVSIHEVDEPALADGSFSATRLARALRDRRFPPRAGRHLARVLADLPRLAGDLAERRRRRREGRRPSGQGRVYRLDHMAEQAPDPESRVTLSDRRDELGMPRVRLDWRVSASDLRSMVRSQEILDEELRRARVGRLQISLDEDAPAPPGLRGGWHHMGTTRMHVDPKRGVVDPDGAVHGVANLYVTGSSVFPTVGYANPLLTIGALALRLADHLRTRFDG